MPHELYRCKYEFLFRHTVVIQLLYQLVYTCNSNSFTFLLGQYAVEKALRWSNWKWSLTFQVLRTWGFHLYSVLFLIFGRQGPFLVHRMDVGRANAPDQCISRSNILLYAKLFCIQCRSWVLEYYFHSALYILLFALIYSKVYFTLSVTNLLFSYPNMVSLPPLLSKLVYTVA